MEVAHDVHLWGCPWIEAEVMDMYNPRFERTKIQENMGIDWQETEVGREGGGGTGSNSITSRGWEQVYIRLIRVMIVGRAWIG